MIDLQRTQFLYTSWVSDPVSVVFQRSDGVIQQFLTAKRGNAVYMRKVERRFRPIRHFFDQVQNGYGQTDLMFCTFTVKRSQSIEEAWADIGKKWNNFGNKMRQHFGALKIVRCFEAHRDGYPHIHALIKFNNLFKYFIHNRKYRCDDDSLVSKIKSFWGTRSDPLHGWVDIQAMINGKYAIDYLFKYICKLGPRDEVPRWNPLRGAYSKSTLNYALLWLFHKRAYAVSRSLRAAGDLIRGLLSNSYMVSSFVPPKERISYEFIGINTKSGFIHKSLMRLRIKAKNLTLMEKIQASQDRWELAKLINKHGLDQWWKLCRTTS